MTTVKNNTTEAAAQTEAAATEVTTVAETIDFLQLSKSENLEKLEKTFSIVPSYLEITKKAVRVIFGGVTESKYQRIDRDSGEVLTETGEVAIFYLDGKMYVNRGKQLLQTLSESNLAKGTPIEIVLSESRSNKSGTGKTNIYDVIILK